MQNFRKVRHLCKRQGETTISEIFFNLPDFLGRGLGCVDIWAILRVIASLLKRICLPGVSIGVASWKRQKIRISRVRLDFSLWGFSAAFHFCDVIWVLQRLKSPRRRFVKQLVQAKYKEKRSKHYWLFVGWSTSHWRYHGRARARTGQWHNTAEVGRYTVWIKEERSYNQDKIKE